MRHLSKREVESMLDLYDSDPRAALATAISATTHSPVKPWDETIASLGFDGVRAQSLLRGDIEALDALLKELVENRTL